MQLSVLSSWPRQILQLFEQHQLPTADMLTKAGIDPIALADPNSRIPSLAVIRLWQQGAQLCPGDITLQLAAGINAGSFHALGFAMATSNTGLDALKRLEQYYPVLATSVRLKLIQQDELVGIRLSSSELLNTLKDQFSDQQLSRAVSELREAAALGLLNLCRSFFGVQFVAQSLYLQRDLGTLYEPYQQQVGCQLIDNARYDEAWFRREDLLKPLPSANAHLAELNDQIVQGYLNVLKKDVSAQVASQIIQLLATGELTQEKVAERLNISVRSLQRKLADQGQSFRSLVSQTRQELALQYIRHPNIPILEIGFRLGFTEPANFTRAFKQWTGSPPGEYRQRVLAPSHPE